VRYAVAMTRIALLVAPLVVAVLGCGGETQSQAIDTAGVSQTCGPSPDASATGCGFARAYLWCADPSGAGEGCPADDPTQTQCKNNGGPSVGGGPWTCHDQCKATEYSLSCGGIGPYAPQGNPPAACRFVGAVPAGIAFYCCPCAE
jgi:hypothetical protein